MPPMPAFPETDLGFTVRPRKGGEVEVLHRGRLAARLGGLEARELLDELPQLGPAEAQQRLARLTGNYKRGNERLAAAHPRNRR